MAVFLDCDGVLANFEEGAIKILGMRPREYELIHGENSFWDTLYSQRPVFRHLERMPDALILYDALSHHKPAILTGCPFESAEDNSPALWAIEEKTAWAAEHFPDSKIHCVRSVDKRALCQPGDYLIDDWHKYRHLWEEAGGIFIHHFSARETIIHIMDHHPHLLRSDYVPPF